MAKKSQETKVNEEIGGKRMYEKMTVAELKALAEERGIKLGGATRKADIIAAIEDAPITVEAEVVESSDGLSVMFSPATLSANFDSLERKVSQILSEYDGWEPDPNEPDDVKNAKTHRAYLNGLAREIDERRKAVKREFMAPYDAFEKRANAIRDSIKSVSSRLDAVVKESDEAWKNARYTTLQQAYEAYAGLLSPVVPYSLIHESSWCNRSIPEPKAVDALENKVDSVARSWETLKSLGIENFEEAEARFFQSLSLDDAISFAESQREQRAKVAEMNSELGALRAPVSEETRLNYEHTREEENASPSSVKPVSVRPAATFAEEEPRPAVMVINSITTEQMREVGRILGGMGLSGVFKRGTLQEAARREAQSA